MMMHFSAGSVITVDIPTTYNTVVYILDGHITTNGVGLEQYNTAVYKPDGEIVTLSAQTNGKLLFLSGQPINEPVESYGPFIMNYPGEIKQAIWDFENGEMGVLES